MKNVWNLFQLILMTVIITFLVGCFFYGYAKNLSNKLFGGTTNFIYTYDLEYPMVDNVQEPSKSIQYRLITSCYFSLTTLSTVGYGDLSPKSNEERLFGVVVMLCGVAFFSLIMGSFIEIISTFNQNLSNEEQTFELHNWMTLLTRFRDSKPLPNQLYRQINQHFKYYWANNRLASI